MAAGEDEREPLVWKSTALGFLVVRHGCLQSQQQLALAFERALAADPVDGAVLRHGHDPGSGIAGGAVRGPALDGECECVLDGLLGALEVAERAGQHRDGAPPFLPEDGFDARYYIPSGNTTTGRISTDPWCEPGSFAAHSVASSSEPASIR